jgi:CspA family cold shock protein
VTACAVQGRRGTIGKGLNMATGKVKWFNATKGFGFIVPDEGGKDVFVHISAVERSGLQGLQDDQPIEYELYHDERRNKTSAVDLKLI